MPRSRKLRPRPSTPNLKLTGQLPNPHTADPTSPPETPTASPPLARKISLKPRHQPEFFDFSPALRADPNIKPVGNGHQFSYQPVLAPDQLSPRSSSESSEADDDDDSEDDDDEDEDGDDDDDDSSDDDDSDNSSDASLTHAPSMVMSSNDVDDASDADTSDSESSDDENESEDGSEESDGSEEEETTPFKPTSSTFTVACGFILEDIDPMDSDCEGLEVLYPTEIESNRSRSRSRHRGLERDMVKNMKNLNCSNETSDNEVSPGDSSPCEIDQEEEAFNRRREQLKKFRRMSMGSSFGKRTHSELSDSDDDGEAMDVNEVGSSARRLRRKMHRTSLLFTDPPQERIDELEEPDSSEDESSLEHPFYRELPYWGAMEIMEVDSA